MGRCAFLSFRLGASDGVSLVARQWERAMQSLGWETVTVAGPGPGSADRVVTGLEIGATHPPTAGEIDAALADADLVVVENLLTIPMNLAASRVVARLLGGRPALLHHHDPAWQRERFAHITELPPDDPAWRHVTINDRTRRQMADRGIAATTIYNGFELGAPLGDRTAIRARLGVADDEPLVVHPVRAIARKNIPAALDLAERIGATYWLTGPPEEDYGPTLERILRGATTRVLHQSVDNHADAYAAADLVVFPSLWEGFGNPPVDAAVWRRPVVVGNYPIAAELRSLGFDWPSFDWPSDDLTAYAAAELVRPDRHRIDHNRMVAERELGTKAMTERLDRVLQLAGWRP